MAVNLGSSRADQEQEADQELQGYLRALLLAYLASQNRSLFAARCLVQTCIEAHRSGISLRDLEGALTVAGLQSGGQLLAPLEQETALSWAGFALLTLEAIGVPLHTEAERRGARAGELEAAVTAAQQGMRRLVAQTVDMYRGGFDARRMLLQQALATPKGGLGPFAALMQQNTRLIILTLEVVRDAGLPTAAPLGASVLSPAAGEDPNSSGEDPDVLHEDATPSAEELRPPAEPRVEGPGDAGKRAPGAAQVDFPTVHGVPMDYVYGFLPDQRRAELAGAVGGDVARLERRAAAVRLQVAFTGALAGSLLSVTAFVEEAFSCYREGFTAQAVFNQLQPDELMQSGIVLPIAAAAPAEAPTGVLLAQWLSIAYIALAQLGVERLAGSNEPGWAWAQAPGAAGGDDAVSAHSVAAMVANALRLEDERESGVDAARKAWLAPSAAVALAPPPEAAEAVAAAARLHAPLPGSFVVLPDADLARSSPAVALLRRQVGLVQQVRELVIRKALESERSTERGV
ncbi:hypothetical protein WJX81_003538 [Elliptochloris bilobata]|uniref:Uncharacterized protein n=1 Tax=Elliptochloris bilobata TaxID=381761 RepID=A0AAW1RFY1_9CHLO